MRVEKPINSEKAVSDWFLILVLGFLWMFAFRISGNFIRVFSVFFYRRMQRLTRDLFCFLVAIRVLWITTTAFLACDEWMPAEGFGISFSVTLFRTIVRPEFLSEFVFFFAKEWEFFSNDVDLISIKNRVVVQFMDFSIDFCSQFLCILSIQCVAC